MTFKVLYQRKDLSDPNNNTSYIGYTDADDLREAKAKTFKDICDLYTKRGYIIYTQDGVDEVTFLLRKGDPILDHAVQYKYINASVPVGQK